MHTHAHATDTYTNLTHNFGRRCGSTHSLALVTVRLAESAPSSFFAHRGMATRPGRLQHCAGIEPGLPWWVKCAEVKVWYVRMRVSN